MANPIATILSAKMLMEWLAGKRNDNSAREAANRIEKAVDLTLKEGKKFYHWTSDAPLRQMRSMMK